MILCFGDSVVTEAETGIFPDIYGSSGLGCGKSPGLVWMVTIVNTPHQLCVCYSKIASDRLAVLNKHPG